jgi:hypothetical protein
MKFIQLASLFVACFASAEEVEDVDVSVLTDQNFKDFVAKNPLSLIECNRMINLKSMLLGVAIANSSSQNMLKQPLN